MAAAIVVASRMHSDAGPRAREAVMDEADLWLGHLDTMWAGRQRRARIRRRWALACDAAHRRRQSTRAT